MKRDFYEIKEEFSKLRLYGLEDVDCGEALAVVLWGSSLSLSVPHALRSVIGSVFFRNFRKTTRGSGKIRFFFTPSYGNRADHRKGFYDVVSCADHTMVFEDDSQFQWNWRRIRKLHYIAKWMGQMRSLPYDAGFRLYCCSVLFSALMLAEESVPGESEDTPSLCVTFCDVHPIDYFITCWYNRLGIPTATLQHGVYGATLEKWAFLYSHSLFFLAINEYEVSKYRNSGAAGTPVPLGALKFIEKQPEPIPQISNHKVMGVVLGNVSTLQNEALMLYAQSIAKKLGLRVLFRCHPANKASDLTCPIDPTLCEENRGELSTLAEQCDFAIADWSTSAISDLIVLGCPVFRLYSSDLEDFYHGLDIPFFSDEASLEWQIASYIQHPESIEDKMSKVRRFLCPEGAIKENYIHFFKKFEN